MLYRSPFKVYDVDQIIKTIKKSPKLIIYGTGSYGALALHALNNLGIKVSCFGDNNTKNWGTKWKGHKIISNHEMQLTSPDTVFIVASARFKYMTKQLKKMGFKNIFNCDFLFSEFDMTGVKAFAPIDKLVEYLDLYMYSIMAEKDEIKLKIKSLENPSPKSFCLSVISATAFV